MVLGPVFRAAIDAFEGASDWVRRFSVSELHDSARVVWGIFIEGSWRHRGPPRRLSETSWSNDRRRGPEVAGTPARAPVDPQEVVRRARNRVAQGDR